MGEDFLMTIKFTDAVKFHKDLPHQNRAWEFLQASVHKEILDEFARLYRNETQVINSSSIPKQALDIIKEFEGFSSKAYYDPHTGALPITIAYGSTRKMNGTPFYIGETITKEEGEKLLIYQLNKEFLPPLQKIPYWNEMNDEMKSALLDFAYNLGANFCGASGFNTITKNLKEKDWKAIPKTLELYRNPGSNVEAGLLRRRRREGLLWREGLSKLSKK
jgi:GH24 family phage-related lysozyme (muramidase)